MQFSWKWVFPVLAGASLCSSNSLVAGLVLGAILTVFFFVSTLETQDSDVKWICFVILLILAFVFGYERRNHDLDRERGIEHEFEYDRDRP